jgi:hypothetical protein
MLLLVQSEDPFYEGLLESDTCGEEPSLEDEVALMGFDHAELGAAVVRNWNLPQPLPQIVALHHDWEGALRAGGAVCAMVALLRAAERIVPVLRTLREPTLDDLTPLLAAEPAFAHLGITREELFRSWEGLRRASEKASLLGDAPSVQVTSTPFVRPPPRAVDPPRISVPAAPPTWMVMGAVAAVAAAGALIVVLLA